MVVGRTAPGLCNMVHLDESWKAYVRREAAVAKKWQQSWGFLRDEYQMMTRNIHAVKQRGRDSQREQCGGDSQREQRGGDSQRQKEELKLPPIAAPKQDTTHPFPLTTHPFPLTTSQEVGWRSTLPECKLEVYGRWGRPKYSIIKHLQWPNDAVP